MSDAPFLLHMGFCPQRSLDVDDQCRLTDPVWDLPFFRGMPSGALGGRGQDMLEKRLAIDAGWIE